MNIIDVKKIQQYDTYEAHNMAKVQPGDMICVYGTLRTQINEGHFRASAMDPVMAGYTGKIKIPRIAMLATQHSGFPYAVVTHNPDHFIVAEAYQVTPDMVPVLGSFMQTLDMIEGAPRFYHRCRVRDTEGQDYWLYTIHEEYSEDEHLVSGNWEDIVNGGRY